jgi:hypothetical protein
VTSALRVLQRVVGDRPLGPVVGLCIGLVLGLAIAAAALSAGSSGTAHTRSTPPHVQGVVATSVPRGAP